MKLTKAQEKVITKAKADIDRARTLSYPEWIKTQNSYFVTREEDPEETKQIINAALQKAIDEKYLYDYWENGRKGVVCMHCNTRTLKKLEEYGIIEIIEDSTGQSFGIDVIKLLNY